MSRGERVQCQICGDLFWDLSEHIVDKHGMSVEEYRGKYIIVSPRDRDRYLRENEPAKDAANFMLKNADPKDLVNVVANAGLKVFNSNTKNHIISSSMGVFSDRINEYYHAGKILNLALGEIEKRLCPEQVDKIKNKDLVAMAQVLQNNQKIAIAAAAAFTGMVVQDNKSDMNRPQHGVNEAFSGEEDKLPIPPGMGPYAREKVREYALRIAKEAMAAMDRAPHSAPSVPIEVKEEEKLVEAEVDGSETNQTE